jgi:hypothetical protein
MIKKSGYILQIYFFVSGVLFLGLALSYGTNDIFLSGFIPPSEKTFTTIGYVTATQGDTRIRPAGELLWLPGKSQDPIHEHDSVFTGADGKMKISVGSTTTLQVNQDSLFKINRKDHLTTVQLFQGEITSSIEQQEQIKIQAKGKTKIVNLNEVDKKISYRDFEEKRSAAMAKPFTEDLKTALGKEDDFFSDTSATNKGASSDLTLYPTAPAEPSPSTSAEVKGLGEESNKKILWMLGLAYGLFSLLAMLELTRQRH